MTDSACDIINLVKVPSSLQNITDEYQPGKFIVGSSRFVYKDVEIVNIFHRQVGRSEEILLGLLSVILIAIVAEIFQTILLRTSSNNISVNWLISAFLVDEFMHFRNGYKRLHSDTPTRRHLENRHQRTANQPKVAWYQRRATLFVLALFISALLLSAEVLTVILTQPNETDSKKMQYNLQARQPIQSNSGLQKFIRRTTKTTPCITPAVSDEKNVRRNYVLSACVIYREKPDLIAVTDVSENITLWSFFHEGGSDHRFRMGNGGLNVSIRVTARIDKEKGDSQYLEYKTNPDHFEVSEYLHQLVMNQVVQSSCNKGTIKDPPRKVFESLSYTSSIVKEDIHMWETREGHRYANNTFGLKTEWKAAIPNPYERLVGALWPLIASGVVEEVKGPGLYSSVATDERSNGFPGLITEEGHIAGVYLFLLIVSVMTVVLIVLKCLLKPLSLGSLALAGVEQEHNMNILHYRQQVSFWHPEQQQNRSDESYNNPWPFSNITVSREDDIEGEDGIL